MTNIADDLRSSLLILLETRSGYLLNEVNGNGNKLTVMPEWINHIYNVLVPAKLFELNFTLSLFFETGDIQYNIQAWYLELLKPPVCDSLNKAFNAVKNQDLVLEICLEIKNYAHQSKSNLPQDLI